MPVTLLDVAKTNGTDGLAGLVEEVALAVPEVGLIPTQPIQGITYTATVRTGLPTGGFRSANEGMATVKSTIEQKIASCHIANIVWQCDKAVADSHAAGAPAYMAVEALGCITGEFIAIAKQLYYGTGNDSKGFPGLDALADASMAYDATGSAAGTGSSVWGLRLGPQGIQFAMGMNGALQMSEPQTIVKYDTNGNPLTVYHQELLCWIGLLMNNKNAAVRIKNLTAEANHKLTDSMLAEMLSLCPVGQLPDVLLMNRRSVKQLRQSRTATNATGAPAPTPTEFDGIPIVITDAITSTETIA